MDLLTLILGVTPPAMAILAEFANPISPETIATQLSAPRGAARELAVRPVPEPPGPEGSLPAAVVNEIVQEIATPAAREIVRSHLTAAAARRAAYPAAVKAAQEAYDGAVESIARTTAEVAAASARVAGIVPTWISITAGFAAVLIEMTHDPAVILAAVAVWIVISGFFAVKFFATLNYYATFYLAVLGPRIDEQGSRAPLYFRVLPNFLRRKTKEGWITLMIVVVNLVVLVAVGIVYYVTRPAASAPRPAKLCPIARVKPTDPCLLSSLPLLAQRHLNPLVPELSLASSFDELKQPFILIPRPRALPARQGQGRHWRAGRRP